jgi:hypothetical protein
MRGLLNTLSPCDGIIASSPATLATCADTGPGLRNAVLNACAAIGPLLQCALLQLTLVYALVQRVQDVRSLFLARRSQPQPPDVANSAQDVTCATAATPCQLQQRKERKPSATSSPAQELLDSNYSPVWHCGYGAATISAVLAMSGSPTAMHEHQRPPQLTPKMAAHEVADHDHGTAGEWSPATPLRLHPLAHAASVAATALHAAALRPAAQMPGEGAAGHAHAAVGLLHGTAVTSRSSSGNGSDGGPMRSSSASSSDMTAWHITQQASEGGHF